MHNEKIIPQQIPIEKIHDLPGVTDFKLPEKSYGTLVSSILVNGLREPVILRPQENGEYQLVHGYRRRKAAELAKLKTLDALVYDMTEKEAKDYRLAVAANPEAPIPGKLITPDTKAQPKLAKATEKRLHPPRKKMLRKSPLQLRRMPRPRLRLRRKLRWKNLLRKKLSLLLPLQSRRKRNLPSRRMTAKKRPRLPPRLQQIRRRSPPRQKHQPRKPKKKKSPSAPRLRDQPARQSQNCWVRS